jgi:hypothetical protein
VLYRLRHALGCTQEPLQQPAVWDSPASVVDHDSADRHVSGPHLRDTLCIDVAVVMIRPTCHLCRLRRLCRLPGWEWVCAPRAHPAWYTAGCYIPISCMAPSRLNTRQ